MTPVPTLIERVAALERRAILDDGLHHGFETNDNKTAMAIDTLAKTINDPEIGLIVRLREFQAEVRTDRRVFKAWIAGATAVMGLVFSLVTIFAPLIRAMLHVP